MSDFILECYVQPNAKICAYVGIFNTRAKIKINSPAVDGKANAALIKFIATEFKVSKKQVSIIKGQTSRHKTLIITMPYLVPTWLQNR